MSSYAAWAIMNPAWPAGPGARGPSASGVAELMKDKAAGKGDVCRRGCS